MKNYCKACPSRYSTESSSSHNSFMLNLNNSNPCTWWIYKHFFYTTAALKILSCLRARNRVKTTCTGGTASPAELIQIWWLLAAKMPFPGHIMLCHGWSWTSKIGGSDPTVVGSTGHPRTSFFSFLLPFITMENSEETPLLSPTKNLDHEQVYSRFGPARKRGILAIVSLVGLIPRTSLSLTHLKLSVQLLSSWLVLVSGTFIPSIPQIAKDLNSTGAVVG